MYGNKFTFLYETDFEELEISIIFIRIYLISLFLICSYVVLFQFEVGEVASIIGASIILTLLVDLPIKEVKKTLWKQGNYS
jgi:hypothetical protein